MARGSVGNAGGRSSFGNSGSRAVSASAHSTGNSMGGGWRSFGGMIRGSGAQISAGYRNNARSDGQWHSFGNSRGGTVASNVSGWSPLSRNRGTPSYAREPRSEFSSNRFSANLREGSRFSSFDSGRFSSDFRSSRFGDSGFGSFGVGNSGFGGSGFSSSLIGADISILPNLLFGGLLRVGSAIFGVPAILAADAISLAANSIISGLVSNDSGQGSFAGDNAGFGASEFSPGFGYQLAPVPPPCGVGLSFGGPGWAWGGYCGPYPPSPLGWSGRGYFNGGGIGYNAGGYSVGGSDTN